MIAAPLAVVLAAALLRRSRAAVQTARPVRLHLERAAAAAIACNVTSAQPPPAAARAWGRSGSVRLRGWGTRTTAGLLRSPLRERIHLERLVFLSMEHCAAQPEVVADVLLQVRHRQRHWPHVYAVETAPACASPCAAPHIKRKA